MVEFKVEVALEVLFAIGLLAVVVSVHLHTDRGDPSSPTRTIRLLFLPGFLLLFGGAAIDAADNFMPETIWESVAENSLLCLGAALVFLGVMRSLPAITSLSRNEQDLREVRDRVEHASRLAKLGYWSWRPERPMGEPIVGTDRGTYFYSDGAGAIFGCPATELSMADDGDYFRRFVYPLDQMRARHSFERLLATDQAYTQIEYRIVRPDGEERVIDEIIEKVRTPQGEVVSLIGTIRDVTEDRLYSAALQRAKEDLELKVVERTQDLTQEIEERKKIEADLIIARENAEAANKAKSEFMANMSHELRTPLNAIIGIAEMLIDERKERGETDELESLQRIKRAGGHLLQLINDILDLAKVEAGRLELDVTAFELNALVSGVVELSAPLIEGKGNHLHIDSQLQGGSVVTDRLRLKQILINLLSNANKFTDKGSIDLIVRPGTVESAQEIQFIVKDTGIGMNETQVRGLFQKFVQVSDEATRRRGGTGLGLALSRQMAQLMGGDISVESSLGRGSTFTLRIPRRAPGWEDAPARKSEVPSLDRKHRTGADRVVVVDDDPVVCELFSQSLRAEGFEVTTAGTVTEGLTQIRALKPAAIVIDIGLPDGSGWDVLIAVKSDLELAHCRVIMISVEAHESRAFSLGASDFLVKPVHRQILVDTFNRLFGEQTSRRALIVEDNAEFRYMVGQVLLERNWAVMEATNGQEGLAILEKAAQNDDIKPDVVVLDLIMPGMDGFRFIEHMRARPDFAGTPVLVLTAKDLTEADRQRLAPHVQQVIGKGRVDLPELAAAIGQIFGRKR